MARIAGFLLNNFHSVLGQHGEALSLPADKVGLPSCKAFLLNSTAFLLLTNLPCLVRMLHPNLEYIGIYGPHAP